MKSLINNRMIDEFDERMREMGLGGPSKQKQREFEIKS